MEQYDDYDDHSDVVWLRDQLRQRDRTIADLKKEKDELNELIRRFDDYVEDYNGVLARFKQALDDMAQNEDGAWTSWDSFWDEYNTLIEDYAKLAKRYNRLLPLIGGWGVGRSSIRGEAQVATVAILHKLRKTLRSIIDETRCLTARTARTIAANVDANDRATRKRLQRIEIYKSSVARWRSRKLARDVLPLDVQKVIETGNDLLKEANGLGRARDHTFTATECCPNSGARAEMHGAAERAPAAGAGLP